MARTNLVAVAILASCVIPDEKPAITNENIAEAMRLAQQRKAEKATEDLAETLEYALGRIDCTKLSARRRIREYREAINHQKAIMDRVDLALAYGNESSNFVPLMVALGMGSYARDYGLTGDEFAKLSKVPEGWAPKVA